MQSPSTIATTRHRAARRLLVLLVAVLGTLIGTTAVASATTASQPGRSSRPTTFPVTETRVGVARLAAPLFVGHQSPANPVFIGQNRCNYDGIVSASCVACLSETRS